MNQRQLLCGTVILLEIAAAAALLQEFPAQEQAIRFYLTVHCGGSLLLSVIAARHTSAHGAVAEAHRFANCAFFFCIAFLVPVIGACISFAFLGRPIGCTVEEGGTIAVTVTGLPGLPNEFVSSASIPRAIGAQTAVSEILKHAKERERRLAALIAARDLPARDAIALARLALTDSDDEVRLLAYTMLNVQEEGLEKRIQTLKDQLAAAVPECRWLFHQALAHTYWETVYLRLNTGVIESFMLEAALEHVYVAQRHSPLDAGLRLLLGRILMHQGQLDQSAMVFNQARYLGIALRTVAPFLNEITFMQRRAAVRLARGPNVVAHLTAAGVVVDAVEGSRFHASYRAAS